MTLPVDASERTPVGHLLVMSASYFNCLVFFLLVSAFSVLRSKSGRLLLCCQAWIDVEGPQKA